MFTFTTRFIGTKIVEPLIFVETTLICTTLLSYWFTDLIRASFNLLKSDYHNSSFDFFMDTTIGAVRGYKEVHFHLSCFSKKKNNKISKNN